MSTTTFGFFFLFLFGSFSSLSISQNDSFLYNGFSNTNTSTSAGITLNGASRIQDNGIIRLTKNETRLIGRTFYPEPLKFKNSVNGSVFSFSTAFVFTIIQNLPTQGGHGLAFTIAPTATLSDAFPTQYLGLLNSRDNGNFSNHIFFVELDTVEDFEFDDIDDNHVGININNMRSNKSTSVAYYDNNGVKHGLFLKSGETIQAWIDYDGDMSLLNVTVAPLSTKPKRPLLSYPLNLSSILHQTMYVGFSSSTGLLASSHYILGWNFKMNGDIKSFNLSSFPSVSPIWIPPKKRNVALIVGTSVPSIVLIIVAAILFYKIKNAGIIEPWELQYDPHRFSYKELYKATKGFRDKELLGFGGFGKVYKGVLPSTKTEVAVKRIAHDSERGLRGFLAEIDSIGRLRHRNLVQLQGWCRRSDDLLLVYDYMPNGSLDTYLFDHERNKKPLLSWTQRFWIIRGVASALLYLHEEWEHVVIHRDVKASNVLLDDDMNGHLGDFGLAKLYDHGANPNTTKVVGTIGYLAPELTRTGKPTTSSDVFAFGTMVLEVICGRRPIELKALPEKMILIDWVWETWKAGREVMEVVDPRLEDQYRWDEVELALKVGLICSHPAPTSRPTMRDVVRYLDADVSVPEVHSPSVDSEGRSQVVFDDYLHSYPSSSLEVKESEDTTNVIASVNDGERRL